MRLCSLYESHGTEEDEDRNIAWAAEQIRQVGTGVNLRNTFGWVHPDGMTYALAIEPAKTHHDLHHSHLGCAILGMLPKCDGDGFGQMMERGFCAYSIEGQWRLGSCELYANTLDSAKQIIARFKPQIDSAYIDVTEGGRPSWICRTPKDIDLFLRGQLPPVGKSVAGGH